MSTNKKLYTAMTLPKAIVRVLFFMLIAPMVYHESGVITTMLLGLLSIELAIKGDWMDNLHSISMTTAGKLADLYEFQNDFIEKRNKNKCNK